MSLLEISHLTTKFETQQGTVSAVRDVSYHLEEGEVLGIVGESGSGKSVGMLTLMGLLASNGRVEEGEILFDGENISPPHTKDRKEKRAYEKKMQQIRGNRIGMIFQDPMTFLNPILKIGIQMTEGIRKHQNCSKKEAEAKAIELMRQVGIPSPEKRLDQYPFEFSGGMRQRIIIATALACDPKLIIADEPTTALDVTVQAQILELLKKLTKEKGTSVIMITHDLGVVASMCDRIAIMYAGQIVEEGTVDEIFYEPHHPYTKGLLNSINNSAKDNDEPLVPIPGTPPDLLKLPKGCAFMSRCPYTMKICEVQASPVTTYSETHCCRCWLECMDETKITVSGEEAAPMSENVLEVKNLCKYFDVNRGMKGAQKVIAVDGISFEVKKGETFGLVGESGCGKSTLGRTILRIYEPTKGEIVFEGEDISRLSRKKMLPYRQKLQMIFQDPYASLNPRFTVGEIIEEPMVIHHMHDEKKRKERVQELLETVGLKPDHIRRYPHEFSGGQRQRIGIARTLALEPDFIVCDEPISALDVSIQAQVINLLEDIQKKEGISYLFIAHDLGMVKHISHRIGVMYLGHMVEIGESNDVYRRPLHPYSKALLSAEPIPDPKTARSRKRILLEGEIPSPIHPPKGCPFHTRCPYAMEECSQARPATYDIEGRKVACFLYSPRYLRQREGLAIEPLLAGAK